MSVASHAKVVLAVPSNSAKLPAKAHHIPAVVLATQSPFASLTCACASNTTATPFSNSPIITTTTQWAGFAKRVSGEWDGFGADFTGEGTPIHLPESVVPDAFREWEVEVYDWQTQCPTLANPDSLHLAYKTIKLLPTVGCEADAATRYSVIDQNPSVDALAFAYHSSGSYVAVWPIPGSSNRLGFEHCLVNPDDRESRIRIIQTIDAHLMKLNHICMFSELWYGPFRNGDQLGGCAIGNSAFASTPALDGCLVTGTWHGHSSSASFWLPEQVPYKELAEGCDLKCVRDARNLILLPRSVWCGVSEGPNEETKCEVGWLYDTNSAVTTSCVFTPDSKLKEISLAQEFMNL